MKKYDEISALTAINNVAATNTFVRTNGMPLDNKSIFKSIDDALEYIGSSLAYEGQLIAISGETGQNVYVIDSKAPDNLKRLADSNAENLSTWLNKADEKSVISGSLDIISGDLTLSAYKLNIISGNYVQTSTPLSVNVFSSKNGFIQAEANKYGIPSIGANGFYVLSVIVPNKLKLSGNISVLNDAFDYPWSLALSNMLTSQFSKIQSIEDQIVTFANGFGEDMAAMSSYNEETLIELIGTDDNALYCPIHPEVGNTPLTAFNSQHAEGGGVHAIAQYSHAEGRATIAEGRYSHAEGGNGTIAGGLASHAEGFGSVAIGNRSHAEGTMTSALGMASHAEGSTNLAQGGGTHAEGVGNMALCAYSHVEGYGSRAGGKCSHAAGNYARTYKDYSYVWSGVSSEGTFNTAVTEPNSFNIYTKDGTGLGGFYLNRNSFIESTFLAMSKMAANDPNYNIRLKQILDAAQQYVPPKYWGLTFTAVEANSTIKLEKVNSPDDVYLAVSFDYGITWQQYAIGTTITLQNVGDIVCFAAEDGDTNDHFGKAIGSVYHYHRFAMTGKIAASGNIGSLLNNDKSTTKVMGVRCYSGLFENCSSLINAPELPETDLHSSNVYERMFSGCSSLVVAPELPATKMTMGCYYSMFSGCSSLVVAPELPATTLNTYCYTSMFSSCSSLIVAPKLPAKTLINYCYYQMFSDCISLREVHANFEQWPSVANIIGSWLNNVSSNGTFYCNSLLTDPSERGNNTVPAKWTIEKKFVYHAQTAGYNAIADDSYSWIWNNGSANEYSSQGEGTFNINPKNDISGFYIGTKNLDTIIAEKAGDGSKVAAKVMDALQAAGVDENTALSDVNIGNLITFLHELAKLVKQS